MNLQTDVSPGATFNAQGYAKKPTFPECIEAALPRASRAGRFSLCSPVVLLPRSRDDEASDDKQQAGRDERALKGARMGDEIVASNSCWFFGSRISTAVIPEGGSKRTHARGDAIQECAPSEELGELRLGEVVFPRRADEPSFGNGEEDRGRQPAEDPAKGERGERVDHLRYAAERV